MGTLSEHFDREEFDCRCCRTYKDMDPRLIAGLEELRKLAGGRAVHVHSGYRCPRHNKAVGGAKNSQHMRAKAADITIEGRTPAQVADLAEKIACFAGGGIGRYPNFTHVDVRRGKSRW